MSKGIEWDDIDPKGNNSSNNSGDLFLKLSEGTHTVRLVGRPVKRYTAWINKKKYVVPEEYVARLEAIGIVPRITYAINIFDRADTAAGVTRFKILEKGSSIFAPFATYAREVIDEETGEHLDPGGKDGPNWKIMVKVPNGDKRRTTYEVLAMPRSCPFKKEEMDLIRRPKTMSEDDLKKLPLGERGLIDLEKFYDLEKAKENIETVLNSATGGSVDDGDDLDAASSEMASTSTSTTSKSSAKSSSNDSEEDLDDMISNAF